MRGCACEWFCVAANGVCVFRAQLRLRTFCFFGGKLAMWKNPEAQTAEQYEREDLYQRMYLHLFRAVTRAVDCLQRSDSARASDILIKAQQETEEMYIDSET